MMNKKQYLREITDRACLPYSYRKKVTADLGAEFDALYATHGDVGEVIRRMGEPDEVAAALYESFASSGQDQRPFVEYRSKAQLWGMPLVHIVKGRRQPMIRTEFYSNRYRAVPTAKGIIAIGRRAKGVVAIGNIACGVLSMGNISVGLLTISNLGVGLVALGNLAVGTFAIGNGAAGYCAAGNAAAGQYALGHTAQGAVALSVESFDQTQLIQGFIQSVPQQLQGFFRLAVWLVDHPLWLVVPAAALLVAAAVAGVIIANRMETKG